MRNRVFQERNRHHDRYAKIYVADLAAYNAGRLRGTWIDATKEPDEILAEEQAMLAGSPEPAGTEWPIHDHRGLWGVYISEWASFEDVHALALLIEEHGALGAELLSHWNDDVEEVRRLFHDRYYLGAVDSVADYAEEIIEETIEIPEALRFYVDYVSMARDMELNSDIFSGERDGQVHIFVNHQRCSDEPRRCAVRRLSLMAMIGVIYG